jgi:hypothetical protein
MSKRNICEKLTACVLALAAASLVTFNAAAADYPGPKKGDFLARDFRFHTGEVMPELRLHYTTIGAPRSERDSWIRERWRINNARTCFSFQRARRRAGI